jgi:hypothetical protein
MAQHSGWGHVSDDWRTDDPSRRNPIGVIGFIVALCGLVPVTTGGIGTVIGCVLLAAALILGIVAITRSGLSKVAGISAIVISVVGFFVAYVVARLIASGFH